MATKQPNILILWGDDIGQFNISAYNQGMMGYKTPNRGLRVAQPAPDREGKRRMELNEP